MNQVQHNHTNRMMMEVDNIVKSLNIKLMEMAKLCFENDDVTLFHKECGSLSSATLNISNACLELVDGAIRTGIAVTVGYAPIPLTILDSQNTTELAMDVVKLSQSEKAAQIVIGLPLHKNGTISDQANIVQNFSEIVSYR